MQVARTSSIELGGSNMRALVFFVFAHGRVSSSKLGTATFKKLSLVAVCIFFLLLRNIYTVGISICSPNFLCYLHSCILNIYFCRIPFL